MRSQFPEVSRLSASVSVTPDSDYGNMVIVSPLLGDITIQNPIGTPNDGQWLRFRIYQDSTGGRTVSWGDAYAFTLGVTSDQIPTSANSLCEVTFEWNSEQDTWNAVQIFGGNPQPLQHPVIADSIGGSPDSAQAGNIWFSEGALNYYDGGTFYVATMTAQ